MMWLIFGSWLILAGIANIDFLSDNPSKYAMHWFEMGVEKPPANRLLYCLLIFVGLVMCIFGVLFITGV